MFPAGPTFQSNLPHFDCSPVPSIQEWPSICNDSSQLQQAIFSQTFVPTQHATQKSSTEISCLSFWFFILMFWLEAHDFSLPYQGMNNPCIHLPDIPNWMLIHAPEKIVTVLFQVQIVEKLLVNTRINVVLLEKHICPQLVARVLLPMLRCFPRSIHCCLELPKS